MVRNVEILHCQILSPGAVGCAIFENVLVDGLYTRDVTICWGPVFKHVTLRGKIGRFIVNPMSAYDEPDAHRALHEANAAYYRNVDWALDIREADFVDLTLRGVPGRLIRRDPANSVLVSAARLRGRDWKIPGVVGSACEVGIKQMAYFGLEDLVMIACGLTRAKRQRELDAYKALRDAGLAEPD